MRRRNNEMLVGRAGTELPPGILRVMVLMNEGESRWRVISFFDDAEAAAASEEQFERLGDEIPESVRGKRVSLRSEERRVGKEWRSRWWAVDERKRRET